MLQVVIHNFLPAAVGFHVLSQLPIASEEDGPGSSVSELNLEQIKQVLL